MSSKKRTVKDIEKEISNYRSIISNLQEDIQMYESEIENLEKERDEHINDEGEFIEW